MRPSRTIPHRRLERSEFYAAVAEARLIGTGPAGSSWRLGHDLLWTEHGPLGSSHLVSPGFFPL